MPEKKTALILSGGGAKGAFECGAEKYAREVKGYKWDLIAGVSVGALNSVMLAMEKYDRLYEIWNTISDNQVYTGGFNLWSIIKLLFGAQSFYGNQPLRDLLAREYEPEKIKVNVRIGSVSLVTGEYTQFVPSDPNFDTAVLASTVMPLIWEPVNISPAYPSMVDGGVRNISPIGDVLQFDPDEIVIINCGSETFDPLPAPPNTVLNIGYQTLEIMLNELFRGDMGQFQMINGLVKEAAGQGVTLHHPTTGQPLKYYDCKIIEPETPLGDTLDFSQPSVQKSLKAGWDQAKKILGE
jgi:NTE family protein